MVRMRSQSVPERAKTQSCARAWSSPAKPAAMVSEAIAKGDVQAINYFVAQKYVEALKEIGGGDNHKLVFMPMEATGLIGAIGGIAELTKRAPERPSGGPWQSSS